MTNTIRTSGFQALTTALIGARKAAGMTQRDLAQHLGCQPATVANIETGQRRVDVIELVALANALGVSPRDLFDKVVENVDASELVNNFSRSKKSAREEKIAKR